MCVENRKKGWNLEWFVVKVAGPWKRNHQTGHRTQKKFETRRGRRADRLAQSRVYFNKPLQVAASRVIAG